MPIVNKGKDHGPVCDMMREAFGHRAAWLYLLLDEAKKRGHDVEEFARPAIRRMGHIHGGQRFSEEARHDLRLFARQFATEIPMQLFDMEIVESTAERFVVDFHFCPLLAAWQNLTSDEKELAEVCDIAMDGDRGIADTLPDYEFTLESTIAGGDKVCRLAFSKKESA